MVLYREIWNLVFFYERKPKLTSKLLQMHLKIALKCSKIIDYFCFVVFVKFQGQKIGVTKRGFFSKKKLAHLNFDMLN